MNLRRFLIEGATLVIAAIILGLVANAIAGAERKVALAAANQPVRQASAPQPAPAEAPETSIIEDASMATDTTGEMTPGPAGQTQSATAPAGSPQKVSKDAILERFPPSPDVPAEEIHTADAKWLWDQSALFLDARRTSIYEQGHIPGARPFAVWEADVDDKVKNLATEGLDPDMPIVIYCSGGECEDSHMLAQKLWGMFFNNLRVYHEGYPGWTGAGYPIDRGAS